MSRPKVTLREVAQRANVHYSTASTVLNGARGNTCVSAETSLRVIKAAEDLSYRVNRAAQQLKTKRSKVVGLLTGDVENPFFGRMVSVCSEALEDAGYDLVLTVRRTNDYSDYHLLESLLSRDLAGVIIWSETMTEVRERIEKSGASNVVVLGASIEGFDSVRCDLDKGIGIALDHLRDQGRTRIGYFAPVHALNRFGDPRDVVYRQKMNDYGFKHRIFSYEGEDADMGPARVAAEDFAEVWKSTPQSDRPDALLCFNDVNAVGVMMGLKRCGIQVPEDIAIVGCDNLPIAKHLEVPLTSVDYPLGDVCRRGVEMLLERINNNPDCEPRSEGIEARLMVRQSSSPEHKDLG